MYSRVRPGSHYLPSCHVSWVTCRLRPRPRSRPMIC